MNNSLPTLNVNRLPACTPNRLSYSGGMKEWQKADAARLRVLWEARKPRVSQLEFAAQAGIGSQGLMHQYLKPLIPLNIPVAIKFAKGLHCAIVDFSPTLAMCIQEAIPYMDKTGPSYANGALEQQLLVLFRGLHPKTQDQVLGNITRLYQEAHPTVSVKPPSKLRKVD